MTLEYVDLYINYGKLVGGYNEPRHRDHYDYVDFDYDIDDSDIIDYLLDHADDELPEEWSEEESIQYIEDHFDELTDKYMDGILDYFEDKATEAAEEYYQDSYYCGGYDEQYHYKNLKESVDKHDSEYLNALAFLDEHPTAYAYICSAEINGQEMPVGKGIMTSEEYQDYIKHLGRVTVLGKVNTMYQNDKEEHRKMLHDYSKNEIKL